MDRYGHQVWGQVGNSVAIDGSCIDPVGQPTIVLTHPIAIHLRRPDRQRCHGQFGPQQRCPQGEPLSEQQGLGLQNEQRKEDDVFLLSLATQRSGFRNASRFPYHCRPRCHSGLNSMLDATQAFATQRFGSRFK